MKAAWGLAPAAACAVVVAACGNSQPASSSCMAGRNVVAIHRPGYDNGAFGPVWSPDGSRIAFSWQVPGGSSTDEYVADVATGTAKLIVEGGVLGQWAPDSSTLVLDVGERGIGLVSAAGGRPTIVTDNGFASVWSPDGCWIAMDGGNADGIAVLKPDGTDEHDFGLHLSDAAWSADSRELVASNGALWTIAIPDGPPQRLIAPPRTAVHPVWSPDRTEVAYAVAPAGGDLFYDEAPGGTIHVVNVATGETRRIASGNAPMWSPDGRQIAFMQTDGCSRSSIAVIRPDGTGLRVLTHGGLDTKPAWSPDSRRLVYRHGTSITGCNSVGAIWTVARDGSGAAKLVHGALPRR